MAVNTGRLCNVCAKQEESRAMQVGMPIPFPLPGFAAHWEMHGMHAAKAVSTILRSPTSDCPCPE